jgi:hypothetical protein
LHSNDPPPMPPILTSSAPPTARPPLACSDADARPILDDLERQGLITVLSKRPHRIQRSPTTPPTLF